MLPPILYSRKYINAGCAKHPAFTIYFISTRPRFSGSVPDPSFPRDPEQP